MLKAASSEAALDSATRSAEYSETAHYSAAWFAEIPVRLTGKMAYWAQGDEDEDQEVRQDLGHIHRRP